MRRPADPEQCRAFAARLTAARVDRGMSQMDLSAALGYESITNVRAWEIAARLPAYEQLRGLAHTLFVSSDYLLGLTDDPSPRPAPGPDPAEVEAKRYARAVEALAGQRKRRHVTYVGGWKRSGDEGQLVAATDGRDAESRFARLVQDWYDDHLIDVAPRSVTRHDGLADMVDVEDLTLGEFRWLCAHVRPDDGLDQATTTNSLAWWLDHLRALRAELERQARNGDP